MFKGYTVNHSGGTTGGLSKRFIRYQKGVLVECDEGDLDHVKGAEKVHDTQEPEVHTAMVDAQKIQKRPVRRKRSTNKGKK